jgi:hypothetical protein
MNRGLRGRGYSAVVYGAQGIELSGGFRDQAVGVRRCGGFEQLSQKLSADVWHVAGDKQVPVGFGNGKSREKAANGTAIFDFVGHDGKAQVGVAFNRAEDSHVSGGYANRGGDLPDHGCASQRQEGFVASHAAAGASRQNEARSHEMILATSGSLCPKEPQDIVDLNKKVYICLIVALAMLAASPSRAADSNPVAPSVPAPAVHKTQVVKADPRTGKLVRSVVVSSKPGLTKITPPLEKSGADLNAIVDKAARAHDVDPLLVHSMIKVESNYDVHAVSNKGAEGLMQLTPSTARMLGVSNSFDPQQNIEAGVKYLKYLKDQYKDDRLALAAYNAGPGAVDKYKWIPPYAETENYVYQVGKRYGEARRAADAAKPVEVPAAKTVEMKPVEIKPAAVEQFIDENGRLHLKTAQ